MKARNIRGVLSGALSSLLLAFPGSARAQQHAVPPFVGSYSENFEEYPVTRFGSGPISTFGGRAAITGDRLETDTFNMFTICGFSPPYYKPSDGDRFLGVNLGGIMRITFSQPVSAFGAYWGNQSTACGFPNVPLGTFTFFDASGGEIGNEQFIYSGEGTLVWRGWTFDTPVKTITFEGEGHAADGMQAILASDPSHLANISTRGFVGTGDDVLIGGLIIKGSAAKNVLLRALGPTLGQPPFNVPNALSDPSIDLFHGSTVIASNDNWAEAANHQAINATGKAPPSPAEAALLVNLDPGPYTAIVRGAGGATGNALFEAYDQDSSGTSRLGNISTRGSVQTGDDVMIAGVIIEGPGSETVLIRALGPTLGQPPFNVSNALQDPFLDLRDANGAQIMTNDNWKTAQQAQIQATGLAPPADAEAAIAIILLPGNYTAIVTGTNNATGNALVEVYDLN